MRLTKGYSHNIMLFMSKSEIKSKANNKGDMVLKNKAISYALLLSAAALIIAGVLQKDYVDNLRKAVLVCLECIGIG